MFKRGRANKLLRQLQMKQLDKAEPTPKQDYLSERDCHRTYSCIHCRAHLANHDELISKLFQGNHGRAYLFNKVVNVGCKQAVERELLTGLHAVADIYCDCCETTLGWKYEQAFVPSQKYKEGKYIIEHVHMLKENNWDLSSYNSRELLEQQLADELAERAAEQNVSVAKSAYRAIVNDRETLGLYSNYLDSASGGRQPSAALVVAKSAKQISNSSSCNTLKTPQLESNFDLNSSGASANSDGASSSGSRENLGGPGNREEEEGTTEQEESQQSAVAAVRCTVEAKNLQDDTNMTMTTRATIEHDRRESADDNSAAIGVQQ